MDNGVTTIEQPLQPVPLKADEGVTALTPEHLEQALGLSQALNWPYRLEDWQFALALGHGFAVEAQGQLVGTALWWAYGDSFASAGMIIVSPAVQRQGIGGRLMDALLADAAGRRMILNSTREGEGLYARLGFRPYDEVTQHQAILESAPAIDPAVPVRQARPEDLDAIKAVDEAGAGMDRTRLLDALHGYGDMVVVEREGSISGYGCVRRWGRGVVIGPVIARDQADARAIVATLAAGHVGDFVRIDVTGQCGLASWLEEIGLPRIDRVLAMSLGEPPQAAPGATLFALCNQSLG